MQKRRIWINLAMAAALGVVVGWWLWWRPQDHARQQTIARLQAPVAPGVAASSSLAAAPDGEPSSDEQNNINVYKSISPAVVNITSTTIQYDFFFNVFPSQGSGSGFLIDDQGNIITNYHVISGARSVEVTLSDQTRLPAKLVGRDPVSDLAVIKIDAKKPLPFVKFGDSDHLQVGQKVLAIGNPFGFEGTLTTGIISSLGRNIRDEQGNLLEDLIQTDAAINPGNSGGPLLNARGEVIGINTAIFGQANLGIGFAIPANSARSIVSDLLTIGRARQAYLGVVGQEISPPLAELLNLPAPQGLLIAQITRAGPADQAGLRAGRQVVLIGNQEFVIGGDLIVELDGTAVASSSDLTRYLRRKKPGDVARVTIFRGRQRMTVDVQLADRGGPI
ncbi:MAG: trypsin-like peptidase domain-containing protein [Acidobacteria bacterium]|nr:trypsin-like peptidase domain-containing protein [Acidobacteriota bacterium]